MKIHKDVDVWKNPQIDESVPTDSQRQLLAEFHPALSGAALKNTNDINRSLAAEA